MDLDGNPVELTPSDSINYIYTGNSNIIDSCTYELRVESHPRQKKALPEKRASTVPWNLESSYFSTYTRDTDDVMDRCFDFDWGFVRIGKWLKNEDELPMIKRMFRYNYPRIKELYRVYASHEPNGSYPGITQSGCWKLCKWLCDCQRVNEINTIFMRVNLDVKFPFKHDTQIVRFQLMEVLFKLAELRHLSSRGYGEAVQKLFDEVQYRLIEMEPAQVWRDKRYWNIHCDYIIRLRHSEF
jgi:hypothetical protein